MFPVCSNFSAWGRDIQSTFGTKEWIRNAAESTGGEFRSYYQI